jgi:hypothetical protein
MIKSTEHYTPDDMTIQEFTDHVGQFIDTLLGIPSQLQQPQ